MSEYQIETRRRSRSKTPFLRSHCDHENCEHAADGEPHHHPPQRKRAKTPNVRTIIEEEVTSSSSPHTSVSAQKIGDNKPKIVEERKSKTSDYSSEGISPENKAKKSLRSEFSEVVTTTAAAATVIKSTTFSSSSSTTSLTRKVSQIKSGTMDAHMATSTPKANNFHHVQKSFAAQYSDSANADESRQNQLNATQERVRKSLYNNSNNNTSKEHKSYKSNDSKEQQSLRQSFNGSSIRSNISNTNIDPKEHLPYMEYKNAGEYWNVTPKTDYTYSELSPHRRELAPGVVAMPNMSRHSLGNYNARVHAMIERYPEKEDWIRRRYQAENYATERYESSGDEIDYLYTHQQLKNGFWFQRFLSSILTFFITCWKSIVSVFRKRSEEQIYRDEYYRKYYGKNAVASKGFFGSITSTFLSIYSYFYSFVSRIIEFDLRLLSMKSRENVERKSRFWLLFLILLPWLVLGGFYYYVNPNHIFLPKSLSQLTNFNMPSMQDIELPKIDLSDYFNEENYAILKAEVVNCWAGINAWTDDYFLYLKTISQNIIDESRQKLFPNN